MIVGHKVYRFIADVESAVELTPRFIRIDGWAVNVYSLE